MGISYRLHVVVHRKYGMIRLCRNNILRVRYTAGKRLDHRENGVDMYVDSGAVTPVCDNVLVCVWIASFF